MADSQFIQQDQEPIFCLLLRFLCSKINTFTTCSPACACCNRYVKTFRWSPSDMIQHGILFAVLTFKTKEWRIEWTCNKICNCYNNTLFNINIVYAIIPFMLPSIHDILHHPSAVYRFCRHWVVMDLSVRGREWIDVVCVGETTPAVKS